MKTKQNDKDAFALTENIRTYEEKRRHTVKHTYTESLIDLSREFTIYKKRQKKENILQDKFSLKFP